MAQAIAVAPRAGMSHPVRWHAHLAIVAVLAIWSLSFQTFDVTGRVLDARTGAGLMGARVATDGLSTETDSSGAFILARRRPNETLQIEADGYLPSTVLARPFFTARVALEPRVLEVIVRDAESGQPVSEAVLRATGTVVSLGDGRFRISPAPPRLDLLVEAPGFTPASFNANGVELFEAALAPRLDGRISDEPSGRPAAFSTLAGAEFEIVPDDQGRFRLPRRPNGPVWALAPGYERQEIVVQPGPLDIRLRPQIVKGMYLTFFGIGDPALRANAQRLLEQTELNAVVIDVKGDRGFVAYESAVPVANAIGANALHTIADIDELLTYFRRNRVYSIARIVVFKDDLLARNGSAAGLDASVRDARTGQPWIDGEGLGWVDPFRPEVWAYNVALAEEAARHGFDEIQLDYIRFPTDPGGETSVGDALFSQATTPESREQAIVTFLRQMRSALHRQGAYLAVDTFGYTTWNEHEMGIGQALESLAEHVDYLCPMVYPSTYAAGLPGLMPFPGVVSDPYRVVYESVRRGVMRVQTRGAVVRPWLQYFDDYPWQTKRRYDAAEIQAQIRGSADAGGLGWMLWDPTNQYARGGIEVRR